MEQFWIARRRESWSPEQRVGLTRIWAESASEALLISSSHRRRTPSMTRC
jgi:hypothetical protein